MIKQKRIVIAGATGALGGRIAWHLIKKGAIVIAIVRKDTALPKIGELKAIGAKLISLNYNNPAELAAACEGADCVVSALSGLHDVIVEAQTQLLKAALQAGVPRFIPSDYCIDYLPLPNGSNRNLDLRRAFYERIMNAPIKASSILNGMFMDLLSGKAPVIIFPVKRVVYWGSDEQLLDFTTMENTAECTAITALLDESPRFIRVAGDVINIKKMTSAATSATGKQFKPFRLGSLQALKNMIAITRKIFPAKDEIFPAWQGMQYLHNMFTGMPKLHHLDNQKFPEIHWTSVEELLVSFVSDRNR